MKVLFHPNREDIQLSSILYALSDPIRLHLVYEINELNECICKDIKVPIAKSTLSHHTRTLREAGVIYMRVKGTQRHLSIRKEDLEARFPGLLTTILQAYESTNDATQFSTTN